MKDKPCTKCKNKPAAKGKIVCLDCFDIVQRKKRKSTVIDVPGASNALAQHAQGNTSGFVQSD